MMRFPNEFLLSEKCRSVRSESLKSYPTVNNNQTNTVLAKEKAWPKYHAES